MNSLWKMLGDPPWILLAILSFANDCRARESPEAEFVSTVGIAGRMRGWSRSLDCGKRSFHNTYEEAKAEPSVHSVTDWVRIAATGPPPSMVVGITTGKSSIFRFYHLAITIRQETFEFTQDDMPAWISSCNYSAKAIIWSASRSTIGKILHYVFGPNHSIAMKNYATTRLKFQIKWLYIVSSTLFRSHFFSLVCPDRIDFRRQWNGDESLPFSWVSAEEQSFANENTSGCWIEGIRLPKLRNICGRLEFTFHAFRIKNAGEIWFFSCCLNLKLVGRSLIWPYLEISFFR